MFFDESRRCRLWTTNWLPLLLLNYFICPAGSKVTRHPTIGPIPRGAGMVVSMCWYCISRRTVWQWLGCMVGPPPCCKMLLFWLCVAGGTAQGINWPAACPDPTPPLSPICVFCSTTWSGCQSGQGAWPGRYPIPAGQSDPMWMLTCRGKSVC